MSHKTVFYSIGTNCMPALCLRHLKLRHTAGPFDWTHTTYSFLLRLLDDTSRNSNDFASLIDPELIKSVPSHTPKALHLWAGQTIRFFEHKDPANSAEDLDHYKRAITHFLQDMRNPTVRVCLLWMYDWENRLSDDEYEALTFKNALHLQKKFIACGGTKVNMIVIIGNHRQDSRAYEKRRHGIDGEIQLHVLPKMSARQRPCKQFGDMAQIIDPFLRRFMDRDAAQGDAQDDAQDDAAPDA